MVDDHTKRWIYEVTLFMIALLADVVILLGIESLRDLWLDPSLKNWIKLGLYGFIVIQLELRIRYRVDDLFIDLSDDDIDNMNNF